MTSPVQLHVTGFPSGGDMLPGTLLGDIIDYDTLKSGENRAGQYSSVLTLIIKANVAIGTGLGFFIVGKMGYDATATTHSSGEAAGLMIALIWIPLALTIAASYFVYRYPLNEHRMSIIKRRIESLALRKLRDEAEENAEEAELDVELYPEQHPIQNIEE